MCCCATDDAAAAEPAAGFGAKRLRRLILIEDSEDEAEQQQPQPQLQPNEDNSPCSGHFASLSAGPGASPAKFPAKAEDGMAEEEDIVCNACGSDDQPENILLCDSCDAGWHTGCLEVQTLIEPINIVTSHARHSITHQPDEEKGHCLPYCMIITAPHSLQISSQWF